MAEQIDSSAQNAPTQSSQKQSTAQASIANPNQIDAGSIRLQPPKITAAEDGKRTGPITVWETPYNRPALEDTDNVHYTRLALQYLQQGRLEEAERLYRHALLIAESTFSHDHPSLLKAIEDLAWFYYCNERYAQAEPLVSRVLKERVQTMAGDDKSLIRLVDQLADIYEKNGRANDAQSLYKFLLARQEETLGRNSITCAFTLSRLAELYLRQEQFNFAETLMLRILEIQENVHGRSSLEISTTLQELSKIYYHLNQFDKSAEMLERLLHILESIHGPNGLSVASCLLRLADLLSEVGMEHEADPLYRRAQDIYSLSYGDSTAAHSVFRKRLERARKPISRASKDKPVDQEECSRFPAIRPPNLEELLPSELGVMQTSRCLGHVTNREENGNGAEREQNILEELGLRSNSTDRPLFMPEPFPSSRRKSNTQSMFPVSHPGRR